VPSSVSVPLKPLLLINPPPHLKLSNLSKVISKFRTLQTSSTMFACAPSTLQLPSRRRRIQEQPHRNTPNSREKRICFVHATEFRPGCPRGGRGGVTFPISANSAVPVCAHRLCADGPGQPSSNVQVSKQLPHRSLQHDAGIRENGKIGTCCGDGLVFYVWILRSTHEVLFTRTSLGPTRRSTTLLHGGHPVALS